MTRPMLLTAAAIAMLAGCATTPASKPAQDFAGIWLYEFEGSSFFEGTSTVPSQPFDRKQAAWLDLEPEDVAGGANYDRYDSQRDCYPVHAFQIRFHGRREVNPYGSGHMGLWGSSLTVDRILELKPLGPQPCTKLNYAP